MSDVQDMLDILCAAAVHEMHMEWAMELHMEFYGVPTGPAIPPEFKGLAGLIADD